MGESLRNSPAKTGEEYSEAKAVKTRDTTGQAAEPFGATGRTLLGFGGPLDRGYLQTAVVGNQFNQISARPNPMRISMTKLFFGTTAVAAVCAGHPAAALTIALSNDDGWSAQGIQALKDALIADHTVILAAPLDEQSSSSAATSTDTPSVLVTKQSDNGDDMEFAVSTFESGGTEGGEPASSALIALSIAPDADLLITGINAGNNLGSFTQISGTVGAATMALNGTVNQQIPAIAVSTEEPCDPEGADDPALCEEAIAEHFARVADFVARFLTHLETKPGFLAREEGLLPVGIGLNINYPPTDNPKGIVIAAQGQTAPLVPLVLPAATKISFSCYDDCAGAAVGESVPGGISGISPDPRTDIKDGDTDYFLDGYITIVPFQVDYTAESYRKFKSVLSGFSY
jgi:5'-nucleotidase